MRAAHAVTLAVLLGAACTSDLELSLIGKSCREAEPRCARGFACDVASNICVPPEQVTGVAGAGGQAGGGSGPGGDGGVSAGGSAGRVEGDAGSGGSMAGAPPGTGGSDPGLGDGDAGTEDASADGGADECTPVTLYRDGDDDGVGDVADSDVRCPEDGWVSQPGDCRDDLPDVFPGQTAFFAEPYVDPTRPAANYESFDFDCDGSDESAPTNSPATPAPNNCNSLLTCQGSGYLPTAPLRSGPGVEPRCGSNLRRTCISDGALACVADDVELADSLIFRCK
jgi:hypothetical protein